MKESKTLDELRVELFSHRWEVFRVCLRMLQKADSPNDEAADMTAETFRSAVRALPKFRKDSQLSTWLHRIAENHCKNHLETIARRRRAEVWSLDIQEFDFGVRSDELLQEALCGANSDPLTELIRDNRHTIVQSALVRLPADQQSIIVSVDLMGMSYAEAAAQHGVTENQVRMTLYHARQALKKRLVRAFENGEL